MIRCACAKTGNFGYEVGPAEEPCRRFRGIVGGFGGRELPPMAHPHAAIVLPQSLQTVRSSLAARSVACHLPTGQSLTSAPRTSGEVRSWWSQVVLERPSVFHG